MASTFDRRCVGQQQSFPHTHEKKNLQPKVQKSRSAEHLMYSKLLFLNNIKHKTTKWTYQYPCISPMHSVQTRSIHLSSRTYLLRNATQRVESVVTFFWNHHKITAQRIKYDTHLNVCSTWKLMASKMGSGWLSSTSSMMNIRWYGNCWNSVWRISWSWNSTVATVPSTCCGKHAS